MDANFAPNLVNPVGVNGFMFWCQKVLPLVYDDSLSYYEVLCKIKYKLNEVIQNSNVTSENAVKLNEAYKKLEDYVNNYFNSANIPEMVDDTLNRMKEDGSLYEYVVSKITAEDINAAPAGFGLGTTSTPSIDLNTCTDNGWYEAQAGCLNVPLANRNVPTSTGLDYGNLFVMKRYDRVYQLYYASTSGVYGLAERFSIDYGNTWTEWAWFNPPLSIGVEYKTTEKFNREDVYAKAFNISVDMGANTTAFFDHGIKNFNYLVRNYARVGKGDPLPKIVAAGSTSVYRVTETQIGLATADAGASGTHVITLYYTKK